MTKHDEHYKALEPHEPWDVIQTWIKANNLLFSKCPERAFEYGNILKYLARIGLKESPVKDLEKAQNYLSRLIQGIKETEKKNTEYCEGVQELSRVNLNDLMRNGASIHIVDSDNDNPDYTNITADCDIKKHSSIFEKADNFVIIPIRPIEELNPENGKIYWFLTNKNNVNKRCLGEVVRNKRSNFSNHMNWDVKPIIDEYNYIGEDGKTLSRLSIHCKWFLDLDAE